MPDIRLHADYDRNGRLTAGRREYNQRHSPVGAIILGNLDKDSARGLHRQPITQTERLKLDRDLVNKGRQDDDLTTIRLHISPAARQRPGCQWFLVVKGAAADKIGVFDQRRRRIDSEISRIDALRYPINIAVNRLVLRLESITLPGSPMNRPLTHDTEHTPVAIDDSIIDIEVVCVDAQRNVTVEDSGRFSIAPFVIQDNTTAAEKIYMCVVQENIPTVYDLIKGMHDGRVRVPFERIIDQSDLWIQDQFQVGYSQGASGWERVVLHLPRARKNVLNVQFQANLADYVNKNLAARNIGLFNDFWERPIPIRNTRDKVKLMSFLESGRVRLKVSSMVQVRKRMLYELLQSPRRQDQALSRRLKGQTTGGFFGLRRQFSELWQALNASLRLRARQAGDTPHRQALEELRTAFSNALNKVRRDFPLVGSDKVCVPDSETTHVQMFGYQANLFIARVWQTHSSENYGGNLEALPPTRGAPLGSVLFGNFRDADNMTTMDPDLINFLSAQKVQRLIEIDTSWLSVAHVDEILCVVPRGSQRGRFSVLRASPTVSISLIDAVIAAHQSGLPAGSANSSPFPPGPAVRSMAEGTVPVTRMFRGLSFYHYHPPGAEEKLSPPTLYLNRLRYSENQRRIANFAYAEGEGARYYPADFTALELKFFEKDVNGDSTNDMYDSVYLGGAEDDINRVQANLEFVYLPVLYDPVSDLGDLARRNAATVAIMPNAINMQVLDRHVFIPKPFGPRMKINHAIGVVRSVLRQQDHGRLAGRVTRRYFRRRKLDETKVWVRPDMGNIRTLSELAAQFADGFPGRTPAEVEQAIRLANRSAFQRNGDIAAHPSLYNWRHLNIPENTVDVFQAYIQIVVESLGLTVHWVDSWYYHVRHGEIHCGTNVIRRPPTRGVPDWWDVQLGTTGSQAGS